jgi:hypothetical protein
VPAVLLAAAREALRWRDPDAMLAALVEEETTAAVRGTPDRLLSFRLGDVTVDLTVSAEPTGVRLIGQVAPTAAMPVEIRHATGHWSGHTDALGRFAAAGLPQGPMRVLAWPPGTRRPVATAVFAA